MCAALLLAQTQRCREAECAELQLRVRYEEQRWVGEGLKVTLRRPDT